MQNKKILLVDDEMDMRIFMSALFEMNGYQPTAVRNGTQGIKKAKEISPALIVLDIMMPGEGGAEMYRQLKADESLKNIPVIMLSGVKKDSFYHYLKMLNISLEEKVAQPDAYMEKPPEPEALLDLTKSLIG